MKQWLICYPRDYRRTRGDEILGTMLEASDGKPGWADRWDLVRWGLRARLGRPASRVVVIFALILTLFGAVLGGEAAAWTSWQAAPSLPGNDALLSMTREGLAGTSLGSPQPGGRDDRVMGRNLAQGYTFLGGADEYSFGFADVYAHTDSRPDFAQQGRKFREQLRTHGWEVSALDEYGFDARRDGLLLSVSISASMAPGQTSLTFARDKPWWVTPVSLAGALLGALAGWLFAGWLSRRTEGRNLAFQALVLVVAGCATVLQIPAVLLASTGPFGLWASTRDFQPGVPPGFSYTHELTRPVTLLSLACVLTVITLAALPRRRTAPNPMAEA